MLLQVLLCGLQTLLLAELLQQVFVAEVDTLALCRCSPFVVSGLVLWLLCCCALVVPNTLAGSPGWIVCCPDTSRLC